MTAQEHFLVTGAMGCIGTWVVAQLIREGVKVSTFDLSDRQDRWKLVMSDDEIARIDTIRGDLTDTEQVRNAIERTAPSHIVHLGGMQFPFCKKDPVLGAKVNVVGTVNVFEAASSLGVQGLSYASSVAVYARPSEYPDRTVRDDSECRPASFYGLYKQANEQTAATYFLDKGFGSVGLRPAMVYGLGRDQGITSDPTVAIDALARNEPFEIKFTGNVAFSYGRDVARDFIAAARARIAGAPVHNTRARPTTIPDFVALIEEITGRKGLITLGSNVAETVERVDDTPVPYILPEASLTSFRQGVSETYEGFLRAHAAG